MGRKESNLDEAITSKPGKHSWSAPLSPFAIAHIRLPPLTSHLSPSFSLLPSKLDSSPFPFPSDLHPLLSPADIIPPLGVTWFRDPLSWLPDSRRVYWVRHIDCGLCWTLVKPFETYGRNTLGWTRGSSHRKPPYRSLLTHVPLFLCLDNP